MCVCVCTHVCLNVSVCEGGCMHACMTVVMCVNVGRYEIAETEEMFFIGSVFRKCEFYVYNW